LSISLVMVIPFGVPRLFGIQALQVYTGSMAPTISQNALVFISPVAFEQLQEGDVISFRRGLDPTALQTHRIVSIDEIARTVTTKGDANDIVDRTATLSTNIIGRVIWSIPHIGALRPFVISWMGRGLLFVMMLLGILLVSDSTRKVAKENRRNEVNRGMTGRRLIRFCGVILFLGALVYLGIHTFESTSALRAYNALREQMHTLVAEAADADLDPEQVHTQAMLAHVETLRQRNPDAVGWISFTEANVEYPILHGVDNEVYLHRTFFGTNNPAGSIFLDYRNGSLMQEPHNLIYGHHMRDGSMFGSIPSLMHEWMEQSQDQDSSDEMKMNDEVIEGDPGMVFYVYTRIERQVYQVISFFEVPEIDDIYTTGFVMHDDETSFETFVKAQMNRSQHDFQIDRLSGSQVMTLSTCAGTGMRYVLLGQRIE